MMRRLMAGVCVLILALSAARCSQTSHAPTQAKQVDDCLALAHRDDFAREVCAPLEGFAPRPAYDDAASVCPLYRDAAYDTCVDVMADLVNADVLAAPSPEN